MTAGTINVHISGALYDSSYVYDPVANNYIRSESGKPHLDREGGNITPSVVIVMDTVESRIFEDGFWREQITTIGSGKAHIFQNGIVTEATWTKSDRGSQIKITRYYRQRNCIEPRSNMDYCRTGQPGRQSHMESQIMAEPFNKPLMRDYWAKYRWRTYVIITTAQAATMFVIIGIMELFGIVHVGWIGLIATLLASLALNLSSRWCISSAVRFAIWSRQSCWLLENQRLHRRPTQITTSTITTGSKKSCRLFIN